VGALIAGIGREIERGQELALDLLDAFAGRPVSGAGGGHQRVGAHGHVDRLAQFLRLRGTPAVSPGEREQADHHAGQHGVSPAADSATRNRGVHGAHRLATDFSERNHEFPPQQLQPSIPYTQARKNKRPNPSPCLFLRPLPVRRTPRGKING